MEIKLHALFFGDDASQNEGQIYKWNIQISTKNMITAYLYINIKIVMLLIGNHKKEMYMFMKRLIKFFERNEPILGS